MNVGFVPPKEWRPPKRQRKIYLPEAEHGENNYVGLILGQNGQTHKSLETKSGSKISIRGRNGIKTKREDESSKISRNQIPRYVRALHLEPNT